MHDLNFINEEAKIEEILSQATTEINKELADFTAKPSLHLQWTIGKWLIKRLYFRTNNS